MGGADARIRPIQPLIEPVASSLNASQMQSCPRRMEHVGHAERSGLRSARLKHSECPRLSRFHPRVTLDARTAGQASRLLSPSFMNRIQCRSNEQEGLRLRSRNNSPSL